MNRDQSERYVNLLLEGLSARDAWTFLTDFSLLLLCSGQQQLSEKVRRLLRERRWDLAVREVAKYVEMPLFTGWEPLPTPPPACLEAAEDILKAYSETPGISFKECSALLDRLLGEMVQRKLIRDFITPPFLADMMVQMLEPWPGCSILDPACGSGGLLLAALAVAVTYVSFRLSMHFYRRRQNGAYD